MSMTTTEAPPRTYPAGERPAEEVPVGSHILYGARDVGRVVDIVRMKALYDGFTGTLGAGGYGGQPVLKFEVRLSGGRSAYIVRFPHEPLSVLEV